MERKSRILIKALRHTPDDLGLVLDTRGWALVRDVLKALNVSKWELDSIVTTNSKLRFEYNENQTKIRASQGHSISGIEVFRDWKVYIPMKPLYHGTATQFLSLIMKGTLTSKSRTHVHLSRDIETALSVGSRHGKPILLEVDAVRMQKDGFKFYESKNGVILVDEVPSEYLSISH